MTHEQKEPNLPNIEISILEEHLDISGKVKMKIFTQTHSTAFIRFKIKASTKIKRKRIRAERRFVPPSTSPPRHPHFPKWNKPWSAPASQEL
jgi:hypothetical protein